MYSFSHPSMDGLPMQLLSYHNYEILKMHQFMDLTREDMFGFDSGTDKREMRFQEQIFRLRNPMTDSNIHKSMVL
jgi:hypothetical protein